MILIKIIKKYRNGVKTYYKFFRELPDEDAIEEYLDDSYGAIYGYSYEWEEIKDLEIINQQKEIHNKNILSQIEFLKTLII